MERPAVVVIDVNETLLDLAGLRPAFESVLPPEWMPLWFSNMLRNSMVASMTGRYEPFDEQGIAALITTGQRAGREVSTDEARAVLEGFALLPPHPDVVPALECLASAGNPIVALTNSSQAVLDAQLRNAGIAGYFAEALSVEAVRKFKPAPATYRHVAVSMEIEIPSMWMVAAHDWDITGAIRAGARGIFVARKGERPGPLDERPTVIVEDLVAAAEAIADRS